MVLLLISKHWKVQLHYLMQSATEKRKWPNFSLNVNSTCTNLKTPLHFALMLNHEEFVLLLLQNGAFFNAKDQDKRTHIEEGLMRKQMTAFKTMLLYNQF